MLSSLVPIFAGTPGPFSPSHTDIAGMEVVEECVSFLFPLARGQLNSNYLC